MHQSHTNRHIIRWKRFSRAHFAAFRSLHREVQIGVLAVAMLATAGLKTEGQDHVQNSGRQHDDRAQADVSEGDLLFCIESTTQGLAGAISAVTSGTDGAKVVHVAIACREPEATSLSVLEASPSHGVWLTPFQDFISHCEHDAEGHPLVIIGRLRDTLGLAASVRRAHRYIGLPYDTLYMPDETEIYCSELVQLSFLRPDGSHIFPTIPMSFSDSSGSIAPYWQQLYGSRGLSVPEGLPGTNPGALSRDTSLFIYNIKSKLIYK